jgi:hypothetical protein
VLIVHTTKVARRCAKETDAMERVKLKESRRMLRNECLLLSLRTATIELDIQHTMEKLKNQMKAHNKEV